jgi:DNA-binding CsgD family transcriptional regulator
MQLQRYFDVSQSTDLASFERNLIGAAQELDFPLVGAVLIIDAPTPTEPPRVYSVSNTPAAYASSSDDPALSARDPVMKRLKRLSVPLIYDQGLYVADGAADLWEEQAAFGFKTGIAVALHLPDHRHFMLGVDRDKALPGSDEAARMMADLQLLAVHAQMAAGRLMAPQRDEPDIHLTAREIEILKLTMDGKSSWAVGQLLGINEGTVNFHVRKFCRKLEVSSKHQAVLKAMGLGMI